MANILSNI